MPPQVPDEVFWAELIRLKPHFNGRLWLSVGRFMDGFDSERLAFAEMVEAELGIPVVVTNDVHMHLRSRKPLQDVLNSSSLHD